MLAFSAQVFPDGDIYQVAANEARIAEEARGSDARGESLPRVDFSASR